MDIKAIIAHKVPHVQLTVLELVRDFFAHINSVQKQNYPYEKKMTALSPCTPTQV